MKIRSALLAFAVCVAVPAAFQAAGEYRIPFISNIATLSPAEAEASLVAALAHQNSGEYAKAIAGYDAALAVSELDPQKRIIGLYNRGLSKQELGQDIQAINDFSSVLKLDEHFAQAWLSRANVFLSSGRADLALNDYHRAIDAKHPRPELALFGQARAYQALGQEDIAARMLERAVVVAPSFLPARVEFSKVAKITPVSEEGVVPEYLRGTLNEPVVGMVGAVMPDLPSYDLAQAKLPAVVRAPGNLLDEAEMVLHSRISVSSLQSIILSQTPALDGPGMVVAETRKVKKLQDRVDQIAEAGSPTLPSFIRIEAASAGNAAPKVDEILKAEVISKLSDYVVYAGAAKSSGEAWKEWDKLKAADYDALQGLGAEVEAFSAKGKTRYRLKIAVDDASQGKALCKAMRAQIRSCETKPRS